VSVAVAIMGMYPDWKGKAEGGVYKMINDRTRIAMIGFQGIRHAAMTIWELWRILGKPIMLGVFVYIVGCLAKG